MIETTYNKPTVVKKIPKPVISKDDKYTIINSEGNLLASANNETEYLNLCRSFLKDPNKESCKLLFETNENTIKKAHIAAVNDTKKSLSDLLGCYEVEEK